MNKVLLTTLTLILMLFLTACGSLEFTSDAEHVDKLASSIADFEVPEGYASEFSAEMSGYTLATYKGSADPSHLYLIQSENDADGAELERMLNELVPGASDPDTRMTVVENRPVTVRGQDATLIISEGTNHDGELYRQATVAFQGKGGPALLLFSESTAAWDANVLDELLTSIR